MMRNLSFATVLVATAALTLPAGAQGGPTGSGKFCLKSASGQICSYDTMAACQQANPAGSNQTCVERSKDEGTVGSGSDTSSGRSDIKSPPSSPTR